MTLVLATLGDVSIATKFFHILNFPVLLLLLLTNFNYFPYRLNFRSQNILYCFINFGDFLKFWKNSLKEIQEGASTRCAARKSWCHSHLIRRYGP